MKKSTISNYIKEKALQVGFDACGIAKADFVGEDAEFLSHWLEKGHHGKMSYLANHFEKRTNPQLLEENARSVIVVLLNYFPRTTQPSDVPQVAKYAYGNDYHLVIKNKLYELLALIKDECPEVKGRTFTDSAPILERYWAKQAGLGWIGKNTNLIHPQFGSFCFIGELLVNIELDYDQPLQDHCGKCIKCIEHCPTHAILPNKTLAATDCISYLTIELKEDIPLPLVSKMNNRVFGCDICQDVCPWNRKAKAHQIADFIPKKDFLTLTSEEWKNMNETQFKSIFANSALKRAGFEKIRKTINNL